jgi:hypothetical protein
MIPKRKPKVRMMPRKEDAPILCPGHGKWLRGCVCALVDVDGFTPLGSPMKHECTGRMEAHHDTTRGAGGGDDQQVPLCALGHTQVHGGYTFKVDLTQLAADYWKASPHGIKYRREHDTAMR